MSIRQAGGRRDGGADVADNTETPSPSGSRTSRIATSGRIAGMRASACAGRPRLADDLDVALALEQLRDAPADDLVVVEQEHGDAPGPAGSSSVLRGAGRRYRRPAGPGPCAGPRPKRPARQFGSRTDRRSRRGVTGSSPAPVAGQPTRTRSWGRRDPQHVRAQRPAGLVDLEGLAERRGRQPEPGGGQQHGARGASPARSQSSGSSCAVTITRQLGGVVGRAYLDDRGGWAQPAPG